MPSPNPNLKYERNLRGWSQGYLAEQIGVADYYISRWESGKYAPSPYYQQKLCQIFGKTAEELGFLTPPPQLGEKLDSAQVTSTEPGSEIQSNEASAPPTELLLPEKRPSKALFSNRKFIVTLLCLLLLISGGTITFFVTQQPPRPDHNITDGNIYVDRLEAGLALGANTSGSQSGWIEAKDGSLLLTYPANQTWGTMFITVGSPAPVGMRSWTDLSAYHSLVVDLRAAVDNQCVTIGIKDRNQGDSGTETKVSECLTTQWSTITIPLTAFKNVDLSHVYVVFEVNFDSLSGMTVEVRNIRYSFT